MAPSFPWPVTNAIVFRGEAGHRLHRVQPPLFPWPVADAVVVRGEAGYLLHRRDGKLDLSPGEAEKKSVDFGVLPNHSTPHQQRENVWSAPA